MYMPYGDTASISLTRYSEYKPYSDTAVSSYDDVVKVNFILPQQV